MDQKVSNSYESSGFDNEGASYIFSNSQIIDFILREAGITQNLEEIIQDNSEEIQSYLTSLQSDKEDTGAEDTALSLKSDVSLEVISDLKENRMSQFSVASAALKVKKKNKRKNKKKKTRKKSRKEDRRKKKGGADRRFQQYLSSARFYSGSLGERIPKTVRDTLNLGRDKIIDDQWQYDFEMDLLFFSLQCEVFKYPHVSCRHPGRLIYALHKQQVNNSSYSDMETWFRFLHENILNTGDFFALEVHESEFQENLRKVRLNSTGEFKLSLKNWLIWHEWVAGPLCHRIQYILRGEESRRNLGFTRDIEDKKRDETLVRAERKMMEMNHHYAKRDDLFENYEFLKNTIYSMMSLLNTEYRDGNLFRTEYSESAESLWCKDMLETKDFQDLEFKDDKAWHSKSATTHSLPPGNSNVNICVTSCISSTYDLSFAQGWKDDIRVAGSRIIWVICPNKKYTGELSYVRGSHIRYSDLSHNEKEIILPPCFFNIKGWYWSTTKKGYQHKANGLQTRYILVKVIDNFEELFVDEIAPKIHQIIYGEEPSDAPVAVIKDKLMRTLSQRRKKEKNKITESDRPVLQTGNPLEAEPEPEPEHLPEEKRIFSARQIEAVNSVAVSLIDEAQIDRRIKESVYNLFVEYLNTLKKDTEHTTPFDKGLSNELKESRVFLAILKDERQIQYFLHFIDRYVDMGTLTIDQQNPRQYVDPDGIKFRPEDILNWLDEIWRFLTDNEVNITEIVRRCRGCRIYLTLGSLCTNIVIHLMDLILYYQEQSQLYLSLFIANQVLHFYEFAQKLNLITKSEVQDQLKISQKVQSYCNDYENIEEQTIFRLNSWRPEVGDLTLSIGTMMELIPEGRPKRVDEIINMKLTDKDDPVIFDILEERQMIRVKYLGIDELQDIHYSRLISGEVVTNSRYKIIFHWASELYNARGGESVFQLTGERGGISKHFPFKVLDWSFNKDGVSCIHISYHDELDIDEGREREGREREGREVELFLSFTWLQNLKEITDPIELDKYMNFLKLRINDKVVGEVVPDRVNRIRAGGTHPDDTSVGIITGWVQWHDPLYPNVGSGGPSCAIISKNIAPPYHEIQEVSLNYPHLMLDRTHNNKLIGDGHDILVNLKVEGGRWSQSKLFKFLKGQETSMNNSQQILNIDSEELKDKSDSLDLEKNVWSGFLNRGTGNKFTTRILMNDCLLATQLIFTDDDLMDKLPEELNKYEIKDKTNLKDYLREPEKSRWSKCCSTPDQHGHEMASLKTKRKKNINKRKKTRNKKRKPRKKKSKRKRRSV